MYNHLVYIRVARPAVGEERVDVALVVGVLEANAVDSSEDEGTEKDHHRLWKYHLVDLEVQSL